MKQLNNQLKKILLAIYLLIACTFSGFAQNEESVFGGKDFISNGLMGRIYGLRENTKSLPDFDTLTALQVIYTDKLDVPVRAWTEGFPGVKHLVEWFGIEYRGTFKPKKPGKYIFRLDSDDGSKLYIDGKLIIDNDGEHPSRSMEGECDLNLSEHTIKVQYFQGPREHIALQLFARLESESEQIFPGTNFELSTPRSDKKENKTLPFILFTMALSLALDLHPITGTIKGIIEAITGRDMITGDKLAWWERLLIFPPLRPLRRLKGLKNVINQLILPAKAIAKSGEFFDDLLKFVKKLKELSPVLDNGIRKFRIKTGITRNRIKSQVLGGTVASARPDIKGFPRKLFTDGSTRSKGKLAKNNNRYSSPQTHGATKNHAEQNVLGNLADELDRVFKKKTDAKGEVYMRVEQPPCSPCKQGLRNTDVPEGVIKQFSQEYPNIKLLISNQETSHIFIIQNGKILNVITS